ncbi:unnamed protein product [Caenorhabditis auriculariae]|uniref:Uncharacterized protein n=1 Tax=Caenorhabditis auriculariae TaxID=2777116 RepID=A0A8S1GXN3_9PELO|nr:unnamed protein product [Caenorhabditis auriculariae]
MSPRALHARKEKEAEPLFLLPVFAAAAAIFFSIASSICEKHRKHASDDCFHIDRRPAPLQSVRLSRYSCSRILPSVVYGRQAAQPLLFVFNPTIFLFEMTPSPVAMRILLLWMRETDEAPPPSYMFTANPETDVASQVLSHRPIICNNHTEFECVCMLPIMSPASSENLTTSSDSTIPDCSKFIKTDELPVVDMRMRHVNTEALLYTKQSYEEYFKKRIAGIVSHYCQHNTNECPGTALRMNKVSEGSEDDANEEVTYAVDESEPLLTQENVVLLRMEHLRANVTRVLFVIIKNDRTTVIDEDAIIDPVKVKYIIASQATPLSRVLGGIRIDSVRVGGLKRNVNFKAAYVGATHAQRRDNERDNSKLIRIIWIVGGFFAITYLIGLYQCVKYNWKKWQRKRRGSKAESVVGLAAAADGRNYGTLESKRRPSRNGHANHLGAHVTVAAIEERIPLTYVEIDENANEDVETSDGRPRVLSDRQARNLFMCDASQLPREATIDGSFAVYEPTPPTKRKESPPSQQPKASEAPSESFFPPSEAFTEYVEEQYNKSRASNGSPDYQTSQPTTPPAEMSGRQGSMPPVVLLQSSSQIGTPDFDSTPANDSNGNKLRSESPTIGRPRSRRGSRVDEPEGLLDLRELKPLHFEDPLAEPLDAPVPADQIQTEVDPEDRWSSSEEGEVDVYYKMSDDEDGITKEEEEWQKALAKASKVAEAQGNPIRNAPEIEVQSPSATDLAAHQKTPPSSLVHDSDSEAEDAEEDGDTEMPPAEDADNFVYERLREELSPQPPIVVDLDTIDLDLEPFTGSKEMPPPPPPELFDSPPESNSERHFLDDEEADSLRQAKIIDRQNENDSLFSN